MSNFAPIEFSQRFNLYFNNLASNAAPEIDEYEKSLLLTRAQREIIKNRLRKGGNKYQEGVDDSKERFWNFSTLIAEISHSDYITDNPWWFNPNTLGNANTNKYEDFMAILNERIDGYKKISAHPAKYEKVSTLVVKPISYEEYDRLQQKPFKYPKRGAAWSFLHYNNDGDPAIYIITNPADKFDAIKYRVRGVLNPTPIITVDLHEVYGDSNLNIEGEYTPSCGSLPESMYDEVIQRAVELAKASYSSDQSGQAEMQNQITIGQRSE